MSGGSHMDKKAFYPGLIPALAEFDDIQMGAYSAIKRVQHRIVSGTARLVRPNAYTLGSGSYDVSLAENGAIDKDGLSVDWPATLVLDASASTHGTYVGTTAPSAGEKRYIVLAVAHALSEGDPRVSPKDGLTYYYDQDSSVEGQIYALAASVVLSDDWHTNVTLITLIADIVAAGAVPVMICERRDGTTEFAASDVHLYEHYISEAGDVASSLAEIYEILGRSILASVLNDAGTVAGTSVAVPGFPGRLTITGGETLLLGLAGLPDASETYRVRKLVKALLAASSIDFAALSTTYVVRAKLNSVSGAVEVYHGTGNFPYDSYPGPFTVGTDGGASQGFRRTVLDVPLFKVVTGASNGLAPTITPIASTVDIETVQLIAGEIEKLTNLYLQGTLDVDGLSTFYGGVVVESDLSAYNITSDDLVTAARVSLGPTSSYNTPLVALPEVATQDYTLLEYSENVNGTKGHLRRYHTTLTGQPVMVTTINAWWDENNTRWNRDVAGESYMTRFLAGRIETFAFDASATVFWTAWVDGVDLEPSLSIANALRLNDGLVDFRGDIVSMTDTYPTVGEANALYAKNTMKVYAVVSTTNGSDAATVEDSFNLGTPVVDGNNIKIPFAHTFTQGGVDYDDFCVTYGVTGGVVMPFIAAVDPDFVTIGFKQVSDGATYSWNTFDGRIHINVVGDQS